MLPVYRHETACPGGKDKGILAVSRGTRTAHKWTMAMFDLDDLEYGSDFGAPTDHSSGEAAVMMRRVLVGPGPV